MVVLKEPADNPLETVVRPPKNSAHGKHMKATTMPTTYTPCADEIDLTFDETPLVLTYYKRTKSLTFYDPETDTDTTVDFDPKVLL